VASTLPLNGRSFDRGTSAKMTISSFEIMRRTRHVPAARQYGRFRSTRVGTTMSSNDDSRPTGSFEAVALT
jgi:hypothetical protein